MCTSEKNHKSVHHLSVYTDLYPLVSVDFSIQVLSSGSWPFQQSCAFALPIEVKYKSF